AVRRVNRGDSAVWSMATPGSVRASTIRRSGSAGPDALEGLAKAERNKDRGHHEGHADPRIAEQPQPGRMCERHESDADEIAAALEDRVDEILRLVLGLRIHDREQDL